MNPEQTILWDFNRASALEWIDTNGLGGYASSSISGANTRRYHGMLVAAVHPPVGRMVVVSKLDETLILGDRRIELSSNQYPGTVHPQGYKYLQRAERALFPEFWYTAGNVELKKTVAAIHGENTTVVLYEVVKAQEAFSLDLRAMYSCRDFHGLSHANDAISPDYRFESGIFRTQNYQGCPEVFISVPGAEFHENRGWYHHYQYEVEQYRGLDFSEDLYTHGFFSVQLRQGDNLGVILSTGDTSGRDALKLFKKEKTRRENLIKPFKGNKNLQALALAADQFIVRRGELSTIIAGYHWFADWGRDTMIALPGVCLTTGRYNEARQILQQFAESTSEGMLPNRFPDYGESPEYNTIDATLWFFNAIYLYYHATNDLGFVKSVLPVLKDILDWHQKGTRFGIHIDEDGLISGGADGVQLTWMDAKVGDWVVTPRRGKAVEINALWFNALSIMEVLLEVAGQKKESVTIKKKAAQVKKSFNSKFWNEEQNCLYDYIDGDYCNPDIRPNQIYAISLPFPVLEGDKAVKVVQCVEDTLLTVRGLRSLSQSHQDYKPMYGGGVWERDGAYHQGTIWSFLLGPYIDALLKVKGTEGKHEAARLLHVFFDHLREGGLGTVSEIFDAEAPHTPQGCIAQAWGVGEVLRAAVGHGLLSGK